MINSIKNLFKKKNREHVYGIKKDTDEFIDMMAEKEKAANIYGDYRVIRALKDSYKLTDKHCQK